VTNDKIRTLVSALIKADLDEETAKRFEAIYGESFVNKMTDMFFEGQVAVRYNPNNHLLEWTKVRTEGGKFVT